MLFSIATFFTSNEAGECVFFSIAFLRRHFYFQWKEVSLPIYKKRVVGEKVQWGGRAKEFFFRVVDAASFVFDDYFVVDFALGLDLDAESLVDTDPVGSLIDRLSSNAAPPEAGFAIDFPSMGCPSVSSSKFSGRTSVSVSVTSGSSSSGVSPITTSITSSASFVLLSDWGPVPPPVTLPGAWPELVVVAGIKVEVEDRVDDESDLEGRGPPGPIGWCC